MSYKEEIEQLRKDGHSVKEIATIVGCSNTTSSRYCKGIKVENLQRLEERYQKSRGNLAKGRVHWKTIKEDLSKLAAKQWPTVYKDPQMMLFLGLYLGEGYKHSTQVGVTNNDPIIIKLCYDVFRKLTDKKIAIEIICYSSNNKKESKKFWENLLQEEVRIKENCDKRSQDLKKPHPKCKYGRCVVRFNDLQAHCKIMTWIDCLKNEIGALV